MLILQAESNFKKTIPQISKTDQALNSPPSGQK